MVRGMRRSRGTTKLQRSAALGGIVVPPKQVRSDADDLTNVLASVDGVIIIVDEERCVRRCTPNAAAMLMRLHTEVGRRIGELDSVIAQVIETRERESRVSADGGYRIQIRPYCTSHDHIAGAVLTFTDISVAQLTSERQRNVFLAALSDELRTPLSAILLWTDVLRGLDRDDPDRNVAIDTIAECARTESRLIDDLLDLAMSTTGDLAIESAVLDPTPIIRSVIESQLPIARAKQVTLSSDLVTTHVRIAADPRRLQQVVTKLLTNAVTFTRVGTEVRISLAATEGLLELRISDDGPGIDAEFLPRLFEPFAQQDPSKARVHRGLGIGLALVRYLVERQGGTIGVESVVGEGSTFIARFPKT
jgi:signal transduction histidine kinase